MKILISDTIFDICKNIFLIFLLIVTIYPFLHIAALSFNDSLDSVKGGITIWPRKFTLFNFKSIFDNKNLAQAAVVSVFRTVVAVILQVFSTAMVAYAISRKEYALRHFIALLYVVTMYVSGGLIPSYFLIRNLKLLNTFTVYWFPGLTTAFNLIVIRTYINSLPDGLIEAAKLEGANDFYIFIKIVLPLIVPVLATVALFIAVGQWNSWFDTFLYNSGAPGLNTLQFELMKKLQSANAAMSGSSNAFARSTSNATEVVTPNSIRAAMTVVVTVPILLVYPFLQRYFVKGLTIGSLKG